MKPRALVVIVAVLAGLIAYFLIDALGLELFWPHWVTSLAIALVVFGGMWEARKRRKGQR